MGAAITLIILGILIFHVLPGFISGGKNKKSKKQNKTICKIIGGLLVFLGIYNVICILLGN